MPQAIPDEVRQLVDQFDRARNETLSEEDVRAMFINPLFKSLGWAVDSIDLHREVRHEDRVRTSDGVLKAPDYGFYLGNKLKFFVEAKQPGVNIADDPKPAFQLRRYAWSANLPVSVLTDFEEFAIYDTRIEPSESDSSSVARIKYFTFNEYEDSWPEIAEVLGRDAVLEGSIDRLAAEESRGSMPVDKAFLAEIEGWRQILTVDISNQHPDISVEELSYAVEKIVDRVIFLRIAEDRGIERYGQLKMIGEGPEPYDELLELFRTADARYNSGVFHFSHERDQRTEPDQLTPTLKISREPIRRIISSLYYPQPYVFAAIPSDILGRIYEQFLGKVIRLTNDGPRVIEKPEVRKAGGVYYTPQEINEWMVEQTVGKLVEGKTPRQLSSIKIIDPACGSGSFLIAAYEYMLQYHLDWYQLNDPGKWARRRQPVLVKTALGEWRLSIDERKRILTNNIFGVDIDPQATEVSKLSLLLKVLEGETEQVLQISMFGQRALPDLGANIKCGNTLVAFDIGPLIPLDVDEDEPINSFEWQLEFPEVFSRKNPGFDVVIGNPPYVDSEWMTTYRPNLRRYCAEKYDAASGNWDLFCVFVEKSVEIMRKGGLHSFIVPNKIASADYAAACRRILADRNALLKIRDYSAVPVFPVSVYPLIYVVRKGAPPTRNAEPVKYSRWVGRSVALARNESAVDFPYEVLRTNGQVWPIFGNVQPGNLLGKIEKCATPAREVATISGAATVSEAYDLLPLLENDENPGSHYFRVINSGTIDPFETHWGRKEMRYLKHKFRFPVVDSGALQKIQSSRVTQAQTPKVVVAGMTKKLEAFADTTGGFLAAKSTTIMIPKSRLDVEYLAALMNSELMNFVMNRKFGGLALSGGYLRIGPPQLRQLPIKVPDEENDNEVEIAAQVLSHAREVTALKSNLATARVPAIVEKTRRQIAAVERNLNAAIFDLYGLSDDEVTGLEQIKQ